VAVIGALASLDSAFEAQIKHILITDGNENKKDKDKDKEDEVLIIDKGNMKQRNSMNLSENTLSAK
jgi:hypothetical protein